MPMLSADLVQVTPKMDYFTGISYFQIRFSVVLKVKTVFLEYIKLQLCPSSVRCLPELDVLLFS